MIQNHKIIGFTLTITGALFLLSYFDILKEPHQIISSTGFIIYGLLSVFNSFGSNNRGSIALGSILFLAGISIFVVHKFEVLQTSELLFPSILFILGGTSLILFIDNLKNFIFFLTAIILIGSSSYLIMYPPTNSFLRNANFIANTVLELWPVILFFGGVGILLRKNV